MNNRITGMIFRRRQGKPHRLELLLKKKIPPLGYSEDEIIKMLVNYKFETSIKKPLPQSKEELRTAFEELSQIYNTDKCIDEFLEGYED